MLKNLRVVLVAPQGSGNIGSVARSMKNFGAGDLAITARTPDHAAIFAAASLLAILGPQQPLTTFGADAGVLRMALTDGTDAFVTVRDLPDKNAQIAFIQPVHAALASWRRDASLEITLLICTGLVLALLGGGVWYLAPAEARALVRWVLGL